MDVQHDPNDCALEQRLFDGTKTLLASFVRLSLERRYWRIEHVIAPGLRYSHGSYEELLSSLVTQDSVWLDLGCGHQVLPKWRLNAEQELVSRASYVAGIDYESVKHRSIQNICAGDIGHLPFPDQSFNLVTANMVVEHLAEPAQVFAEVRRVLRPGGKFLFHTPNAHGYISLINRWLPNPVKKLAAKTLEGRKAEDVFPTFYRCNTEQAIRRTAEESGLEVGKVLHIPTTATCATILPLAAIELLWIRATMGESLSHYRTNILAVLTR